MSNQTIDDDQRRDELLRRLAKMPPKTQAELKRDLAAARKRTRRARGKPAECVMPVIIGCLPPVGFEWQILGKWPHGDTEDILRGMGQEVSLPGPSSRSPGITKTDDRNPGKKRRVC
jgi:hypothetical protein